MLTKDELRRLARYHVHPEGKLGCFGFGPVWSDWVENEELAQQQFEIRLDVHFTHGEHATLKCIADNSSLSWVSKGKDPKIQLFHCETCYCVYRIDEGGKLSQFPMA
jgi:hypothetical protein